MVREQIQLLLDKSVTRREFLGYVGVIFLASVGALAIFRSIAEITGRGGAKRSFHSIITNQGAKGGYGNSAYGA